MLRLDAQTLSVVRGKKTIIKDINLSFRGGELVALLGPSGSGKSTLLKAMCGFSPGDGDVFLGDKELYANFDEYRMMLGYVPQDDLVHQLLSVSATLDYASKLRLPEDIPEPLRKAKVKQVLKSLELEEHSDKPVKSLSGGQRKRVSVAVELLAEPPVLFLDEPTSGLDPALEEASMQLFRRLTNSQRITLVTTHVLTSLDCVDIVVFMCEGHVLFVGPPEAAAEHFQVDHLLSIYKILTPDRVNEHKRRFEQSELYYEYISNRLAEVRLPLSELQKDKTVVQSVVSAEAKLEAESQATENQGTKKTAEERLQELKKQRNRRG